MTTWGNVKHRSSTWLQVDAARFRCTTSGFTLIEVMLSVTLTIVLLGFIFFLTSYVSRLHKSVSSASSAFGEVSSSLEGMSRKLARATLNTYLDYYPKQTGTSPARPQCYVRYSELQFVSGQGDTLVGAGADHPTHAIFFQAPLGYSNSPTGISTPESLSTAGFYVSFSNENAWAPAVPGLGLSRRYRYRLLEVVEPTELLTIYNTTDAADFSWFKNGITAGRVRPVAENVIAMIVEPRLSTVDEGSSGVIAPNYSYNSRTGTINPASQPNQTAQQHQLPPVVRLTLVVIDEPSATRLAEKYGATPPPLVAANLFRDSSKYSDDMTTLTRALSQANIRYQVLTTDVTMRAAKWNSY